MSGYDPNPIVIETIMLIPSSVGEWGIQESYQVRINLEVAVNLHGTAILLHVVGENGNELAIPIRPEDWDKIVQYVKRGN